MSTTEISDTVAASEPSAAEAFTGRILTDTAATTSIVLAAIGDRLGLFKALAAHGPMTSVELASTTTTCERHVREWLGGMFATGYLDHDPTDGRFTLPAAHAPTLADEPGPSFFGGVHQELLGTLQRYEAIVESFRVGGGVRVHDYPADVADGIARFTAGWHEFLLLPQWMPLLPDVEDKLRRGARMADVGCGAGQAVITLAKAYPASTFVGYDVQPAAIATARAAANAADVSDRVRFAVHDAHTPLPETFDIVTTFDVVHDAVDPAGMLRSIAEALAPDGIHVCLDINCSDDVQDNVGPIASLLYGFSVLLCMEVSLAEDGEGLGTLGLPESVLRRLAGEAGFGRVRRVEIDNPFNALYELRRQA